jgi:acyl-CoA thioesterase I
MDSAQTLRAEPLQARRRRVLVLGDSLTEGYGISQSKAFPAHLQALLVQQGHTDIEVLNAGVSGTSSSSGVPRLERQLHKQPEILILALGINDGLRSIPVANIRRNLASVIDLAKRHGIRVLLAGMKLPPYYESNYPRDFEAMFQDLAREFDLPLIPFLLADVAGQANLNLPDRVHPNENGHAVMARTVLNHLLPML